MLLFIMVSSSGCNRNKQEPILEEEASLEFEAINISYREITRDIEGLGNLVYYDKATIISKVDGVIERIFVKKGDRVEKGSSILDLSNFQLELEKLKIEKEVLSAEEELETAKIQYIEEEKSLYKKFIQLEKLELQIENYEKEIAFLKEHLERKRTLHKKGGITEEELRNLEFSLESKGRELEILKKEYELESYGFRDIDLIQEKYAIPSDREEKRKLAIFINTKLSRKRIEFAEIRLKKMLIEFDRINWLIENTRIKAPIKGVITDISKFVGEKVSTDEAITTILNQDKLLAQVSFSESDLPGLREGEEVIVYIDSLQKEVTGVIYAIDPYIDVKTRSFYVDCLIDNRMKLVPGMFIKVKIPVKKSERYLLIPKESFIRETEGRGYVYTVSKNERIFKRSIIYNEFDNEYIIVIDGLGEGDTIIKNPLMNLMDGMRVSLKGT